MATYNTVSASCTHSSTCAQPSSRGNGDRRSQEGVFCAPHIPLGGIGLPAPDMHDLNSLSGSQDERPAEAKETRACLTNDHLAASRSQRIREARMTPAR